MAIYDTMWSNRGKDKCPNKEFAEQIRRQDEYYDEIESVLSRKEDVIVRSDGTIMEKD